MSDNWSAPDTDGIRILKIDIGAKRTLKGRRKRKSFASNTESIRVWPKEWRSVLIKWLNRSGTRKKYDSLMRAGEIPISMSLDVFDALLKNGLIEIEESRQQGRWNCIWVEFVDAGALRQILGLEDADIIASECEELSKVEVENEQIAFIFRKVMKGRDRVAMKRGQLLRKLDSWNSESRLGTRREFALYSRGDTKGITTTEWKWLDEYLGLERFNISMHTPVLMIKGPVQMQLKQGVIDISSAHGFIGITPETILSSMTGLVGNFNCLRLLENQTTFEHVAKKYGHMDIVIWLPGYPPSWWQNCLKIIAAHVSCPAMIAADPDPSGIEIALTAGELLESCGIAWEPWHMSSSDLLGLSEYKPLTDYDKKKLASFSNRNLPPILKGLANEILNSGKKGEQEGILM